jgi:CheY-like chemotaxis protein
VNQRLIVRPLEKCGHRGKVAAHGDEAIQLLEGESFDLVFMNIQMPEMDGMTKIRESELAGRTNRHPPIVALTAHAMKGDQERFLAAGMDAYLSNPSAPGARKHPGQIRARTRRVQRGTTFARGPTNAALRLKNFDFRLGYSSSFHSRFGGRTSFMALRIAPAVLVDLESVLALMREMQGCDPWSEPFLETSVRANLTELLTNPSYGLVYLASDDGRPVAYVAICFDYSLEYGGKGAWIDELFVEASHRGRGIGTQLLGLAERASFEHGARFLHLEVTHGNSAIELYRRRGFVDHERHLMTKRLHP